MAKHNSDDENMIKQLVQQSTFPKFHLTSNEKNYIYQQIHEFKGSRVRRPNRSLKRVAAVFVGGIFALGVAATTAVAATKLWNVVMRPQVVSSHNGGFMSSITFPGPLEGLYPYGKELPQNGFWNKTSSPTVVENHFGEEFPQITSSEFRIHTVGGQMYGGNPSHLFIQEDGTIPENPNILRFYAFKQMSSTMYINGDTITSAVGTELLVNQEKAKYMHFSLPNKQSFDFLVWQLSDWTMVIQAQDCNANTLESLASSVSIK